MSVATDMLLAGARTVMGQCLAVGLEDRVLILTDEPTHELARHLLVAARELAPAALVLAGPVGERPYEEVRDRFASALRAERPTVTVFAGVDDADLLAWDDGFQSLLDELGTRHAHMPGLDARCLGEGMAIDYAEVARFTEATCARLAGAEQVHVRDAEGTDVLLRCEPGRRAWSPMTGLYTEPGRGGRLPQGETFCAPLSADGTIATRVIGYPFNARLGLLDEPVRIEVAAGRATQLSHPDGTLAAELWAWLTEHENGVRVGELAIGTNTALTSISGNLLFDENVPGVHIAFGHPFPEWTGADYRSDVHVDVVVARPDLTVDGVALLRAGAYVTTSDPDTRTAP
ncbi:aminopeptidase [Conexibacter woesei]|uniref:Leucyl aminopeptidase (Aminopeptidase T)-like protein n=1 Tax=Conexibacter woesei (strain DSM 14684 / CCUG 47730 / CIP 108061 / JCM 11494 / NBRC 100937 / ID131577) TaxID=469383 RepID=D3F1S2_CONWI|nr:aminopeptidase [Conexibacter woesei]ADB54103.1 Leucyl aminopeptidase (aminopeptidase T)-like protein [Conexibacter woesei DSM 14684]